MPLVFFFIVVLGMLCIVRTDTPKFYILNGEVEKARHSIRQMYRIENDDEIDEIL